MFKDKFIEELPDDPILASHKICEEFFLQDQQIPATHEEESYEIYLEAFGIFQAVIEAYQLNYTLPSINSNRTENILRIQRFFRETRKTLENDVAQITIQKAKIKFSAKMNRTFSYEFTTGDLKRVQTLLNELRDNVTSSKLFEDEHRNRILKRLESLQGELHKRMADIDKLWGLIGEAGVVIGKFGKDSKPFVDRIKEISQIAWRTQAKSEELPSNSPMPKIEDKSEDKIEHED